MSEPASEAPNETLELMNIFSQRYGNKLLHYANYLHYAEDKAKIRRRESPHDRGVMAEGFFSRQADVLQTLLNTFLNAVQSNELPKPSQEDPHALQGTFNKAVGAINMIINEHETLGERIKRKGDPRRLEARYRRTNYIPEGMDLAPEIAEEISARSQELRAGSHSLNRDVVELTNIKNGLDEIRAKLFRGRPRIGGDDGGVGLGR
jgi:hypothetical protein